MGCQGEGERRRRSGPLGPRPTRDLGHSPRAGLGARRSRGGGRRVTGEGGKTEQKHRGRYLLGGRRQEMFREEAPGARRRGSPLSWMEGDRGEDRGGAGGCARGNPRRLRRQPGRAGLLAALGAGSGATVHRVRTRAFVCLSPGTCVSAAPSPSRRFQGGRFRLPAPVCRSLRNPGRPAPPGHPGSDPSSRPEPV